MAYAGYLIRVRMAEHQSPDYLAGFLNSPHGKRVLRNMAKSIVGMANINARELCSIRIPLPPSHVQQRYAHVIAKLRAQEDRLEADSAQLEALNASLQQRAFSGNMPDQ
jgi:type I restriction enzyme S subunit